MFPRLHKDFNEKSSIPRGLPRGGSFVSSLLSGLSHLPVSSACGILSLCPQARLSVLFPVIVHLYPYLPLRRMTKRGSAFAESVSFTGSSVYHCLRCSPCLRSPQRSAPPVYSATPTSGFWLGVTVSAVQQPQPAQAWLSFFC